MTYQIGSARHDENGKYTGGKAGDQTGNEVSTQTMYNYPGKGNWKCYRAKSDDVANGLKNAMLTACANNHIGYNQNQRLQIIGKGVNVAQNVNCDCSALVRECIRVASGKDVGNFTTQNEPCVLSNCGLFDYVGIVTTASTLYEGDIIVTAQKGHTAIVTSGNARKKAEPQKPAPSPSSNRNEIIALGQQHSINFTGNQIGVDGIRGNETRKQAVRVVQRGLNLDYNARLAEDGVWGNATERAFGNHYVKRGETQYMVTVAEILCMMAGIDPNGVECAGTFGAGLERASGSSILRKDWFKKMVNC